MDKIAERTIVVAKTAEKAGKTSDTGFKKAAKSAKAMGDEAEKAGKASDTGFKKAAKSAKAMGDEAEKAGNKVQKSFENAFKSSQKASGGFKGFGAAVVVANQALQLTQTAVSKAGEIAEIADSYNLVASRIGAMSRSGEDAAENQQMIFQASQRARGSYMDMADFVTKVGTAAREAFGSTGEVTRFAELITKAAAAGGYSGASFSGAMTQLTQALASGVLRGDEFNSIMENAPPIAELIAKKFGVTTGELRDLAGQGKITAAVVKDAILGAADDIEAGFKKVPVTFGQAMQMGKDRAMNALQPLMDKFSTWMDEGGGADKITKFFDGVGKAVTWASDKIEIIVQKLQPVRDLLDNISGGATGLEIVQNVLGGIANAALWLAGAIAWVAEGVNVAVTWIRENFELLQTIFTIVALVFITYWTIAGAVAVAAAIKTAIAWAAANWPLLLIIGIVVLIITAFLLFEDTVAMVFGAVVGAIFWLGAVFYNIGMGIANFGIFVAEFFVNAWLGAVNNVKTFFKNLRVQFNNMCAYFANRALSAAEKFIDLWNEALFKVEMSFYTMKKTFFTISASIGSGVQAIVDGIGSAISGIINLAIGGVNGLINAINNIPGIQKISNIAEMELKTSGDWSKMAEDALNNLQRPEKKGPANLGRFEYNTATFDPGDTAPDKVTFDYLEYANLGDAFDAGYDIGAGAAGEISGALNNIKDEIGGLLGGFGGGAGNIPDLGGDGPFGDVMGDYISGGFDGADPLQEGGKIGSVGKINDSVSIDGDDLRYLRDISRIKFINQYTTLRPSVTATFGDVRETADVRKVIDALADAIDEANAAALA